MVGRLVQAWAEADPADMAAGQQADAPISWVQPAQGNAVRVETSGVGDIPAGSTVSVRRWGGDDEPGGMTATEVLPSRPRRCSAPVPVLSDPAGLTNQVTVVLVPGGVAADPVTRTQVVDAVTGPVADFWSEQTDGAVRIGVTRSGWTATAPTAPTPTGCGRRRPRRSGSVPGPGKHLLLYASSAATGCAYASPRSAPRRPPAATAT